jgi:hypothetical protein
MADELHVTMVWKAKRMAVASNGVVYPITHFFDEWGDDCEPGEALTCLAGAGKTWFTINLTQYQPPVLH